jgi:TolB-like protein/DNA-binding winged helix-turn-helix (wHTH) protein/tetratricopeptide (TPR) repeat protein
MPVILTDPVLPDGFEPMTATCNEPLQIGDWLVDPRDDSLTRGAERVKIEPRTMRLLVRLAQTPGAVVSQDELMGSVWTGVVVGTASIYQSMSQLRKVLGDSEDPARYIETVARKGYRLIAPVSVPPPAAVRSPSPPYGAQAGASAIADAPSNQTARPGHLGWVAIAAAAGIAVMAAVWHFAPENPLEPQAASIIVLPFLDLTSDKTEQAFCDGLTEETSNWLAQIPTLKVVARTTAFMYRGRDADVREIGRELNISHVLEGSLRRSGDRMRITVQLIDSRNGYHLWSGNYDVEAGDVLNVQEEVARAVAGNLELRMTSETGQRFAGRRSANSEAQRLYLIARSHAARDDRSSNDQAIQLYRQAIEADARFSLAKVWLARALINRRYIFQEPVEKNAPEIERLLAEAARDAPQLADLYAVRGGYQVELRNREAALADLQRALSMNANSLPAAAALGFYYLTAGEPRDALTYFTMASGLDPREYGMQAYRCMALTDLAQYSAAESACAQARALEPESPWVYSVSGNLAAMRGQLDEALRWNDLARERGHNDIQNLAERAWWLLDLGLATEAAAVYDRAFKDNPEAARNNNPLIDVGLAAAVDSGGAAGLERFIVDRGLDGELTPMQAFHLANAALMVADARRARGYVDRALASKSLAPEELASPWLARTGTSYLLISAAALQASGDVAAANDKLGELQLLLDKLYAAGMQTYGVYELRAKCLAMRGRGDEAMTELRRAVGMGWTAAWRAEHEPYFDSLRKRDDFVALLAAVRAKNAATAAKLRPRLVTGLRLLRGPFAAGLHARGAEQVPRLHHDVEGAGHFVAAERNTAIEWARRLGVLVLVEAQWNHWRLLFGPAGHFLQQFLDDPRQRPGRMNLARQGLALAAQEQQLAGQVDLLDGVFLLVVLREVGGPVGGVRVVADDPFAEHADEVGFDEPGTWI